MPNRIREHRKRLGWSLEKLAAEADTTPQQISRLEKSQRGLDDDWLGRLSGAMGISKSALLNDAFVAPSPAPQRRETGKPPTELELAVSHRLRAIQAELNKTDDAMAKMLSIGRSRWANWINAENLPNEEAMILLCDKAKVTMDWLYRGKPDLTNAKAIGKRVVVLRKQLGLTQAELAEAIGIARSTLGEIETGTDSGGLTSMIALADYFKVPLDWLLCRRPPPGGPVVGRFVDQPDELAWLAVWVDMNPNKRDAVLSLLRGRGRQPLG